MPKKSPPVPTSSKPPQGGGFVGWSLACRKCDLQLTDGQQAYRGRKLAAVGTRARLVKGSAGSELLVGCIDCNRWAWPGSDKPFMALPEDDLNALSNLSNARHKDEDTRP